MENRIKTALEFLKDGQSFSVGDLRLGIDSYSCIVVTGWSQYSTFTNLTKKSSMQELEEIKSLFAEMLHSSVELQKFAEKRCIEYVLSFDDYGKASIDICSEKNGVLKWQIELN
ncbi:hypothetical protein MASR2M44_03610 [Bacteroidota bacterium]